MGRPLPGYVVALLDGHEPTRETALDIMRFAREHLAPYKRVRRLADYLNNFTGALP